MAGTDADIAVVGGGPAGSWLSHRLAQAGARVVIFDHSHPREKPCGGGITGRTLELLGPALPPGSLNGVPVARAVFTDTRTAPATVPLVDHGVSPRSSLVVSDRRSFDGALLAGAQASGATHVAERVTDIVLEDGQVAIATARRRWRVGFVAGADGANSLVRRRLARPFSRAQLSIATGVFVRDVSSRDILVEFVADPAGYLWSFPRPDHLAVGICAQADESSSAFLQRRVAEWVARDSGARGRRTTAYSWPIPSLGPADFDAERPAGDRWALAGDAAGLVDPITREGIFFAVKSADLLASALLTGAPRAGASYAAALRSEIYPELARAARLKRGFFRSGFTRLLVEALRHSPRVAAIMADLVAGQQSYASLKRRLVSTFELRLAWKLLKLEWRGRREA
jgi:flavin-dependent dehydrogenase